MKEEINIINQVNNDTTPIVSLSITSLDIEVEEGRVYKDSFFIESENKIPIEGYVCTTSDKMATEVERLEGIRQIAVLKEILFSLPMGANIRFLTLSRSYINI